jgi:hypothetical protein
MSLNVGRRLVLRSDPESRRAQMAQSRLELGDGGSHTMERAANLLGGR